mgnify:CR=1 FL=1
MRRVIKFSASWCNPCKTLAKTLEEVKTDIPIESYDIDDNEQYAKEFNIRSVPTLIMMDENVEVKRKSGAMGKAELEVWLNG